MWGIFLVLLVLDTCMLKHSLEESVENWSFSSFERAGALQATYYFVRRKPRLVFSSYPRRGIPSRRKL